MKIFKNNVPIFGFMLLLQVSPNSLAQFALYSDVRTTFAAYNGWDVPSVPPGGIWADENSGGLEADGTAIIVSAVARSHQASWANPNQIFAECDYRMQVGQYSSLLGGTPLASAAYSDCEFAFTLETASTVTMSLASDENGGAATNVIVNLTSDMGMDNSWPAGPRFTTTMLLPAGNYEMVAYAGDGAEDSSNPNFYSGYNSNGKLQLELDYGKCLNFPGPNGQNNFANLASDFADASTLTSAASVVTLAVVAATQPEADVAVAAVWTAKALGFTSGMDSLASLFYKWLSVDPPDTNFTVIPQPILPAWSPLTGTNGISVSLVYGWNQWLTNQVQQYVYAGTLYTCINRASGAQNAGNIYWENAQLAAASQYAVQLALLLDQEPGLRSNVVTQLDTTFTQLNNQGFPEIYLDVTNAEQVQSSIMSGVDFPALDGLADLSIDEGTVTNVETLLLTVDPDDCTGNFPQVLSTTDFDAAEHSTAESLRESSLVLLNAAQILGSRFRFDLPTEPGYNYSVQFNQNLAKPLGWITLFSTNATAVLLSFTNSPPAGAAAGFYRALLN
ncbi:MAG TPA: hypothetical protein VME24_05530 [Alphaproteobacteria bacterium]|nr:hypothetical protein [Alphaproteobacteria bacterium]